MTSFTGIAGQTNSEHRTVVTMDLGKEAGVGFNRRRFSSVSRKALGTSWATVSIVNTLSSVPKHTNKGQFYAMHILSQLKLAMWEAWGARLAGPVSEGRWQ